MKIKSTWADFQVVELTAAPNSTPGQYSYYRLSKSGWTTHDAIQLIEREWKLASERISFGGLKDRHAQTSQYITIWEGPPKAFERDNLQLEFLGTRLTPYTSAEIAGNHFDITVRDLSAEATDRVSGRLAEVADVGVPNYFDDQRFGSVGADGRFIAREMIAGRYEEALRLALVGPYEHDHAAAKSEKELLRRHWGDWRLLKSTLPRGHSRNLAGWLAFRPGDYRGAVERLRPDLQGLYLAAYQSHIWNRTLAAWLTEKCPPADLGALPLKLGAVPAPVSLAGPLREEWNGLEIPLPSARLKPAGTESWSGPLQSVLTIEGLPLEAMKVGMRKPFFSKGIRRARVLPTGLSTAFSPDEKHPGRLKMEIAFDLPAASYATIVLKRLLQDDAFGAAIPSDAD